MCLAVVERGEIMAEEELPPRRVLLRNQTPVVSAEWLGQTEAREAACGCEYTGIMRA